MTAAEIQELTPQERLDLIGELWESMSQHPEAIELSDAQVRELDRRVARLHEDLKAGRPTGTSWPEARRSIEASIAAPVAKAR